jgi:hypothetical protein
MSHVPGSSVHLPPGISLNRRDSIEDDGPMVNIDIDRPKPTPGQGGLTGKTIQVGDGKQREETSGAWDKAKGFFKTLGKAIGGIIASPVLLAGALLVGVTWGISKLVALGNKSLERSSEHSFKMDPKHTEMMKALATPRDDSVLDDIRVVDKLVNHAKTCGTPVSEQEIRDMVSTGEHICKALSGPGGDKLPLTVTIDGKEHVVESNTYMARSITWFMMAQAAKQDTQRPLDDKVSDMTTNGSFIMKDPGNRMYNFLCSAPTCGSRMSTHFEERIGHDEKHKVGGLLGTNKPSQRGIEDYQNKMAGLGGTMLFDKLKPGEDGNEELFVKIESGGCPPYFQVEKNQGAGNGICRFFAALDRNLGHSLSFVESLFHNDKGPGQVLRQEHVYKGVLAKGEKDEEGVERNNLNKEFSSLVDRAISEGVISGDKKAIGHSVHKMGLPYVHEAINAIQEAALEMIEKAKSEGLDTSRYESVLQQCNDLVDLVSKKTEELGRTSDVHGIVRRGAEVHIGIF